MYKEHISVSVGRHARQRFTSAKGAETRGLLTPLFLFETCR